MLRIAGTLDFHAINPLRPSTQLNFNRAKTFPEW